jgi:hypothetical protein
MRLCWCQNLIWKIKVFPVVPEWMVVPGGQHSYKPAASQSFGKRLLNQDNGMNAFRPYPVKYVTALAGIFHLICFLC